MLKHQGLIKTKSLNTRYGAIQLKAYLKMGKRAIMVRGDLITVS